VDCIHKGKRGKKSAEDKKMKTTRVTLKVLLASLFMLPFAAQAAKGDCAYEVGKVDEAIMAGDFLGSSKPASKWTKSKTKIGNNQSNLLAKLDAAEAKINLDKFSDAIDKFYYLSERATVLATAQKPKLVDASEINSTAGAAMACVGLL
jgi:hypothetical protein